MQKTAYKLGLLAIIILGLVWYFNWIGLDEPSASAFNLQLRDALNECDAITEKSAANLVALVEFQKLEILARKARVFRTCMADHGYIENAAWTSYAAPIAQKEAQQQHISVDESFENLRRAEMVWQARKADHPIYWVKPAPDHTKTSSL